jgi:hypothetical protein
MRLKASTLEALPFAEFVWFSIRTGRFAETTFGSATQLRIRVRAPEEEHVVTVGKVLSWLDGGARSPNEHPHGLALLWLLDRDCNQIRGRDSADAELQRYDASLHLRHGDVDLIQADELR